MMKATLRPSLSLFVVCASAACGATITQHTKSGDDQAVTGAKTIKLDDGFGRSKDTVSYPGGDRVDWKTFELATKSDVTIALKWTAPKPGLDLSMNILDDTYAVLKRVAPSKGDKTRKDAELKGLEPGHYYVQVYASERGDAGEYTLDITATEARVVMPQNLDPLPNPPRLPAIPAAVAAGGDSKVGTLSMAYGSTKLPESYLIDREGNIRYYVVNTRDWDSPDAQRCIRALLEE
jgi:hypothetical protein